DGLATIQSSKWAERGFCSRCGTGLFYRLTAEGKYHGVTSVSLGSLDDQSGISLSKEWFIDKKPAAYSFEGDRQRITEAEVFAMFSGAS
ncbi:MAG TPA: GFA family protein, partial [Polyangiaceae bacterium]|nr:GFA family protein [Polyangiaceae bacterium]